MTELNIEYTDWGVANNYGNFITLHQDLLKPQYRKLLDGILEHELSHTDKTFTFHDLKIDLVPSGKIKHFELFKFMIRRPKTWIQFLPVIYSKKHGIAFDLNMIILYILAGCIVGGIAWLV